jgi:ABC-type transporter Mla subunit MlaD
MTRQAQVGLFTILGIIGLVAILYTISDIGQRASGYKLPVHFRSAAGLRPAALVYMAGVSIGVVDAINLRPDFTTDVVLSVRKHIDIPVGSRFVINVPLTGEPNLQIVPPRRPLNDTTALTTYPRDPADQSKYDIEGTNPATITDLLEQGQGEIVRLDAMLAEFERVEPQILTEFQSTLKHANDLTVNADSSLTRLSGEMSDITVSLQKSLASAGQNVDDLSQTLDVTAKTSSVKVDTLLASLNSTAVSLNASVDSLRKLADNPQIHDNLIATTRSVALTAKTFADLTGDLRRVTGNAETQAQLRDTVANIDAAAQKADSLLASLGGKSSVYGVDAGATPNPNAPGPGNPHAPGTGPATNPGGKPPAATAALPAGLSARISSLAKNLVSLQVRVSQLAPQRPGSANIGSPLLSADRGPQSDVNLFLLPKAKTSGFVGVNDLGATQTWNVAGLTSVGGSNVKVGGGILYSRLGVMATAKQGNFGIDTRLYDLRHPTLDVYGNLFAAPFLQIFAGERDTLQRDRRAVFGLQTQF